MRIASPSDSEESDNRAEWPDGFPVLGFKNLFRFAFLASVLALPNLPCQIYLAASLDSTATDVENKTPASSLWACFLGLIGSCHMILVSYRGAHEVPGTKVHLVIAMVTSSIACVFLVTGTAISAVSAHHTEPLSRNKVGKCFYFNSTNTVPAEIFLYKNLPGICDDCDPGSSLNRGSLRSSSYFAQAQRFREPVCCCCVDEYLVYQGSHNVRLYGVASCNSVNDAVFPVTVTSAVLYGLCLFLTSICVIVSAIITCQCYCCSLNCGPFPKPAPPPRKIRKTAAASPPERQLTYTIVAGDPPQLQQSAYMLIPVSMPVEPAGPIPTHAIRAPAVQCPRQKQDVTRVPASRTRCSEI